MHNGTALPWCPPSRDLPPVTCCFGATHGIKRKRTSVLHPTKPARMTSGRYTRRACSFSVVSCNVHQQKAVGWYQRNVRNKFLSFCVFKLIRLKAYSAFKGDKVNEEIASLLTHQLINSPTYKLTNSPPHKPINSPTHNLITSQICQHSIQNSMHFANATRHCSPPLTTC